MAAVGITLKLFFTGRYNLVSTLMYIFMGWVMLFAVRPLIDSFGGDGMAWLFAGGIAYTLGAVFYSIPRLPFGHAIFHVFGGVRTGAIYRINDRGLGSSWRRRGGRGSRRNGGAGWPGGGCRQRCQGWGWQRGIGRGHGSGAGAFALGGQWLGGQGGIGRQCGNPS
jgi:hypothetical protein